MRYLTIFLVFIILSVGSLLFWLGNSRVSDFRAGHVAISEESTTSVMESIQRFIKERRRLVGVFTVTERAVIDDLLKDPENEDYHQALVDKLHLYFPDHFTYTFANQNAELLFDDFDGLLGDQCIHDIRKFYDTGEHHPRVHPNSEMYHFDIMVPLDTKAGEFIFFLSFEADMLTDILRNSSVPNHELILTTQVNNRKLIEVTTTGSRVHLDRNDFRMNSEEVGRILHAKKIRGTAWSINDLHVPHLFLEFNKQVYLANALIFLTFFIATLFWYKYAKNSDKARQKAEQHKTEFLSTVSHELRTPLTAIKGSVGIIAANLNNDLPDQALELSKLALTNTDRLIKIVNDLLDIQKIEAGKLELDIGETNLSDLVKQSVDTMTDYGKEFNVTYQVMDLLPNTIVKIDGNRFIQILHNLLSNATKYGKHNEIVEVSIIPYKNNVRVAVTDYGSGIPEEFQAKIFTKFSQSHSVNSEHARVRGTGLGLSIVKLLVEKMGGSIFFQSSSEGTTFFIDLKLVD